MFASLNRMSSCACKRWGPGTTYEKPANTLAAKELDTKLKTMMEERDKQTTSWASPNNHQCQTQESTPVIESTTKVPQNIRFWN